MGCGFVSRVLSSARFPPARFDGGGPRAQRLGGHFSGRAVADAVERSTRLRRPDGAPARAEARAARLFDLHAMGFPCPGRRRPGGGLYPAFSILPDPAARATAV